MSAWLRVCSSRALSRLRALFHVGAWCLDPGTHVLSFGHVTGFGHSRSIFCHCVSARSRVRSAPHTLVHVCFVVLHAVRVSIGCVRLCYILCCVVMWLCAVCCFHVVMFCVNTWLMSFLISCVFMSCFAHGWWFVCWPCACVSVLCKHVASVLVFCVPRALMSICLDPTNMSWPHPSCYLVID